MAGYSERSLLDKLGLRPGMRARYLYAPAEYCEILDTTEPFSSLEKSCDFIHAFYSQKDLFDGDVAKFLTLLDQNGMLWISWPKQASKVPTDITEQSLRDVLLSTGLVDIKVCAVTDVWSGLKFVWRKN